MEAAQILEKSIPECTTIDINQQIIMLTDLAIIYYKLNQKEKALSYINKILKNAKNEDNFAIPYKAEALVSQ